MNSNFSFLSDMFPELEKMGSLAEGYLYSDPNTCLFKLGTFAEIMVNYMFDMDNLTPPVVDNTHSNRLKILWNEGLLPRDINDIFYVLRKKRNDAVHEGYDCFEECKTLLKLAHTLAVWFMEIYGDYNYEPSEYILPDDNRSQSDYKELLETNEKLAAELEKARAAALAALSIKSVPNAERKNRVDKATQKIKLNEKETRYLIDEQLRRVGWETDTENLRYSKGTRPAKGRNIAIAEWPTDSSVCKYGAVDYALFVGLKLVGVVEAKADRINVSSFIDTQCREYSMGIKAEHAEYVIDTWGEYKAPFLFATNGRPYLKQLETKSGVWFRDARKESNIAKALQGWIDPQGISFGN